MNDDSELLATLKRMDAKLDRAIENMVTLVKLKAWENERREVHRKNRTKRRVSSR